MKLQFLAIAALFVLLTSIFGCGVRGPGDRFIDAPFDPDREEIELRIGEVLRSSDLRLGGTQEYFIGPGDEIAITLVGRPDILGEDLRQEKFIVTVTDSPMITLPLIGALKVHGKTAQQLQEDLKAAYSTFVNNPVPVVTIENYHYNSVTVLGSVREPGRYPVEFGDTVIDAIFLAKGLTFGGRSENQPPGRYLKVYREKVSRQQRSDLSTEELLDRFLEEDDMILPREEIIIPIEEFIISGDLQYNIPLQPNDIVFIPGAGTVMVHGDVKKAGVVFLGPSLRTLGQVLTERGGLQYRASSHIEVVRTLPDGRQVGWFVNGRDILARRTEDILLVDNDQVFVYRHPIRNVLDSIGNIFSASVNTGISGTYNPIAP